MNNKSVKLIYFLTGLGGVAMKTLLIYVNNALEKFDEEKVGGTFWATQICTDALLFYSALTMTSQVSDNQP